MEIEEEHRFEGYESEYRKKKGHLRSQVSSCQAGNLKKTSM